MSSKSPSWQPAKAAARRHLSLRHVGDLRPTAHAENPQLFRHFGPEAPLPWRSFQLRHGGELSRDVRLETLQDVERGLQLLALTTEVFKANREGLVPYIAIGIKNRNVCGAAESNVTASAAISGMVEGSRESLRDGVVVTNFALEVEHAEVLRSYLTDKTHARRSLTAVVAPRISEPFLSDWPNSGRPIALTNSALAKRTSIGLPTGLVNQELPMLGSWTQQKPIQELLNLKDVAFRSEGDAKLFERCSRDILLGWAVCNHSPSFALTLVEKGCVVSNAFGGQDHFDLIRTAVRELPLASKQRGQMVAVSDSSFPTPAGIPDLGNAGVKVLFTKYGQVREREVAEQCRVYGIALMWLPKAEE